MRNTILALLIAPCTLWACESECPKQKHYAEGEMAMCDGEDVRVEWNNHMWEPMVMRHKAGECGCVDCECPECLDGSGGDVPSNQVMEEPVYEGEPAYF